MKSRRQITSELAGGAKLRRMPSFEAVLKNVWAVYPSARLECSAGEWSWTDDKKGIVVAASCLIETPPLGRHWLAIRPVDR